MVWKLLGLMVTCCLLLPMALAQTSRPASTTQPRKTTRPGSKAQPRKPQQPPARRKTQPGGRPAPSQGKGNPQPAAPGKTATSPARPAPTTPPATAGPPAGAKTAPARKGKKRRLLPQLKNQRPDSVEKQRQFFILDKPRLDTSRKNNVYELPPAQRDTSRRDTLVIVGDSLLKKVQKFTNKDTRLSHFIKRFFRFETRKQSLTELETRPVPYLRYVPYKGKIIRRIYFLQLDPFGPKVFAVDSLPRNIFESLGNKVHMNTRRFVVKGYLLFKEGDEVAPFALSESERLLRETPFIVDARVNVLRLPGQTDSVDVAVVTQDGWTIGGGGSGSPDGPIIEASLSDDNILGLGSRAQVGTRIDPTYPNGYDWRIDLRNNNIGNSFVQANAYYMGFGQTYFSGAGLNRYFTSPLFHNAGGINYTRNRYFVFSQADTGLVRNNLQQTEYDVWLGYASNLNQQHTERGKENNYSLAGRISRGLVSELPNLPQALQLQSNVTLWGQLSYNRRQYYKETYIFGLGRTEDVPAGVLLQYISGYQLGQHHNLWYNGTRLGYSWFSHDHGYYYAGVYGGGYWGVNGLHWRRVVGTNLLWFSRLSDWGNWRTRHFLWLRTQFSPDARGSLMYLSIANNDGIRGLAPAIVGNKKVVFNYEADLYPPLSIAGFRFALIAFADLGLLAPPGKRLVQSTLFQGYGLGLRLRNENLIFQTIQVKVGFYPNANLYQAQELRFFERSSLFYRFNNLFVGKPGEVGFE